MRQAVVFAQVSHHTRRTQQRFPPNTVSEKRSARRFPLQAKLQAELGRAQEGQAAGKAELQETAGRLREREREVSTLQHQAEMTQERASNFEAQADEHKTELMHCKVGSGVCLSHFLLFSSKVLCCHVECLESRVGTPTVRGGLFLSLGTAEAGTDRRRGGTDGAGRAAVATPAGERDERPR